MMQLSEYQHKQLKKFEHCFIEYQAIKDIYQIFERLRFNHSLGGEPESFLLTGEAGTGKTALVNNYLRQFPSSGRWDTQPILNTRIPSKIKEQNLLTQFLIDLSLQSCGKTMNRRSDMALASAVVKELKRKKTELIFVNEIQELVEFTSVKERQAIANTFKYISEEAGISFVLVGMPYAALMADEPQWQSRLTWRREVSYFKIAKVEGKEHILDLENVKHFVEFVVGFANRMGYKEPPSLKSNDILFPLFAVCRGECRKLKHFLRDAILTSFLNDKPTIDKDVLFETFKFKYPNQLNPFGVNLADLLFSQIYEPSKYDINASLSEEKISAPQFTDKLQLGLLLNKKSSLIVTG